ncbi:MAG: GTPase [Longimonas sp.]|uniref:GTPase family protein n=1 Tax=Longimonas sp. TaxID=2039626 RepID=UPI003974E8F2
MPDASRTTLIDTLKRLDQHLDKLPGSLTGRVRQHLQELRTLLLEKRPARFALVGRRGSGKSSLINALFGEEVAAVGHETAQTGAAQWYTYESDLGTLEVLDTRGLQEGSTPTESDTAESPEASIRAALSDTAPDVLLFLIKAQEVDAAIDGDLEALSSIADDVKEMHGHRPPIVGVVTHCDVLEPQYVRLHQPDDEDPAELQEKQERVEAVQSHLTDKMEAYPALADAMVRTFGVALYQSWDAQGRRRADARWQVEALVEYLLTQLPDEAQVEFARLSRMQALQKLIANRLTQSTAMVCAGIAATPTPLADIAPITTAQVFLVMAIGYLGGRRMDLETAREFLAAAGVNVGAGFVLREAARALVQFVPGFGQAVSASVAYAGTYAVGTAATSYFLRGQTDNLEAQFQDAFEEGRKAAPDDLNTHPNSEST